MSHEPAELLMYMWRAKEVAKRANIGYDLRREEELTELEYQEVDEEEILRYLLGGDSETRMNFGRFGITEEDFKAYEEKERREEDILKTLGTLRRPWG